MNLKLLQNRLLRVLTIVTIICLSGNVFGQLSGNKTIPTDYASISSFVTDLNTQGVGAGGVTLNVPSIHAETAPAGGYVITATGTLADPIVINGLGSPQPIITANATLTAGALNDAIFKIVGGDYITISNLDLRENVANTITTNATNNMTEWGIALLYNTTSDGAQNCSLIGNSITLNRTYQNTFGIYANATHTNTAPTTSATAIAGGSNNGLKIYGNNVSNVNIGILVVGATGSADINDGIDIGGTSGSQGNSISNFGTTGTFSGYANVSGTVNGILVRNSKNVNISYNSITSSIGGTTAGTLNGIHMPAFSIAPTGTFTHTIENNNISLRSGLIAGAINGITIAATTSNLTSTLNINANNFHTFGHTVAGTGTIIFIGTSVPVLALNVNDNTFNNISVNTTGSVSFIAHSYSMVANTSQTFSGNSIVTGFAKTGAGGTVNFITSNSASVTSSTSTYLNNIVSNVTLTGATTFNGFNNTDGGTGSTKIITGNTIQNIFGGTSAMNGMNFTYWSGVSSMSNNTISGLNGLGSITGINIGSTANNAASIDVIGNTISSLFSTGTGGQVLGIQCSNTSIAIRINGNTINGLATTGPNVVVGIVISGANNTQVFRNRIYNVSGSNASSSAQGMQISGGASVSAYNNLISDIRTPNANAAIPLAGIAITGGTSVNLYYNTIYLNGTSTGTDFGSCAVFVSTTPNVTLSNNIFINESTPNGTGRTTAYTRSNATLTTYNNASNRNLFFAGVPSAANLIFYDGTNSYQTFATYLSAMTTRDANSFTGEAFTYGTPGSFFVSLTGASADFLRPVGGITTQIESGGINITSPLITSDYSALSRAGNAGYTGSGTAPDLGAYEFEGITPAPVIILNNVTPAATTQCSSIARDISVNITTLSGTITAANLEYAFNGSTQAPIALTNTAGTTWTVTLPISTPLNATVTWSIVVSNSLGITSNYVGAIYADEPLTGATAMAFATNTTVCAGSQSELSATLSKVVTATVGASGLTTTATEELTAFCNRRVTYRQQTVYTAAELTALGLFAGPITSMGYTIATVGDAANTTNFTVLIGNTALSALTGYVSSAGFTTVRPGAIFNHAVGLNTIAFSTPFNWDGTSNIIVEVSHGGSDNINNAQTFYTTTASNTVAFGFNGTATATLSNKRFNTSFTGNAVPPITSVTWMDGVTTVGTGNPLMVNPLATTTYSAMVTSAGCVFAPAPAVMVTSFPVPSSPTTINSAQCGTQTPTASVTSTSGLPTPTFIWYDLPTGGTAQQSDVSTTYLSNLAATTTFYVSELNTATGCESARTAVTITVASADGILASTTSAAICIGSSITLTASNTNPTPNQVYTYSWDGVVGSGVGTAVVGASISSTPTTPGTYTYSLTGVDGGCSAVSSVVVTVNPFVAVVSPVNITCNGYNNGSFTLTSSSCGTLPYAYSVDGGGFGVIPTNLTPGSHTVVVRDANMYLSSTLNLTITEPSTVIPIPTTTGVSICLSTAVANVSATGTLAPIAQTVSLPLTITAQPVEVQTAPGNVVTSVTVPVLPVGAVITGVTINLNGLIPHGNEYQSDVRLGFSGIFTNAAAQGTGAIGFGTVANVPFNYTRTIAAAGFPLTGGVLNLLYWDNADDIVGADDCTFPIGTGVGSIVINYTIPAPTSITWWSASTAGTSLGTGSPFNTVGTTVLPNSNTPGVYTLYAQTEYNGCSSLSRSPVTVTVNSPSASSTTISNCTNYTWTNGTTYTASGTYTQTLVNAVGCDSIATLNLTIIPPTTSSTSISNCAAYTWTNGTTYTSSGTYTQTLVNAAGCDSIATLNLTILAPTASTTTISNCVDYTWTNGTTYTISGTYTQTLVNAVGCDSIATLNLTILLPTSSTTTISNCIDYTWSNGTTYTASGTYTQTLVNTDGCDSIATLNLTILVPTFGSETVVECNSYTWTANGTTYSTSGVYTATIPNAAGCDSLVTLNLTINGLTAIATIDGNGTLSATTGTSYQWINCSGNVAVTGATSQTFTPTTNGSYAVVVTNSAGCSDTSNCITVAGVGIDELVGKEVSIFPNPTSDNVIINFGASTAKIEVLDAQGKLVFTTIAESGNKISLANYDRGIYYFRLSTEQGVSTHKVVKN